MYMAKIDGWTEVYAFSKDADKAKRLAIKKKRDVAPDEGVRWNWESVKEYFGASCIKIEEGKAFSDYDF